MSAKIFEVKIPVELEENEIAFMKKYPIDDEYERNDLSIFVDKQDIGTADNMEAKDVLGGGLRGNEFFYTATGEALMEQIEKG